MISFIATTYNIAPYVEKCLDSIAAIARSGDEVIIVDDGSTDETVAKINAFAASGKLAEGVRYQPILLANNTPGGVGIGANIGLAEASRDTIFFVDGDDWVDPNGFQAARAFWENNDNDVLFTNYLEFDEDTQSTKYPADYARWNRFDSHINPEVDLVTALSFIAVPWRKFYRKSLLDKHDLRFPEGDFFFEDNPFHWAVCMAAEKIGFFNQVTCYHRVKRPGQTMVSTGSELAAFFTHFETIWGMVPSRRQDLKAQAGRWLLAQMSWHTGRLQQAAYHDYFSRGAKALQKIDDKLWNGPIRETDGDSPTFATAERLRAGDMWGVIDQMALRRLHDKVNELSSKIDLVSEEIADTQNEVGGLTASLRLRSIRGVLRDIAKSAKGREDA